MSETVSPAGNTEIRSIEFEATSSGSRSPHEHKAGFAKLPLVLDIDGTLIRTDLLAESIVAYVRTNLLRLVQIIWWLLKGRPHLKRMLAERTRLDFENIPYNTELLQFAEAASRFGRPVYLATASDARVAEKLAERLPFVKDVIASDGKRNLKAENKAEALVERFPDGFDYAGNSYADLPVWQRAHAAILVGAGPALADKVRGMVPIAASFSRPGIAGPLIKGLRPHQWIKNTLIFIPIMLAGQLGDIEALFSTCLAFVALCLVASGTYLVNDILDLANDRKHWSKRNRPIASGRLSLIHGALAAAAAIAGGLLFASFASLAVTATVLFYLFVTLAYSAGLKRLALVDGLVLATLFTLRVLVGIVAADVEPSTWLLVFSMFLFGSLSYAKRHIEISESARRDRVAVAGRGYRANDGPIVLAIGVASGIGAVLILVLYIINDAYMQSFYGLKAALWLLPPLVFLFVSRIWIVCQRNELDDDPVAFAIKDPASISILALSIVSFLLAWIGLFSMG